MDGAQIRRAREAMGWTQAQLAEAVGVGWRTISNWERGETLPQNRQGKLDQILGHLVHGDHPDPLRTYSELTLLNELMRRAVERGHEDNRESRQ